MNSTKIVPVSMINAAVHMRLRDHNPKCWCAQVDKRGCVNSTEIVPMQRILCGPTAAFIVQLCLRGCVTGPHQIVALESTVLLKFIQLLEYPGS